MRWKGRRGSENVEDRRGARGPVAMGGGGMLLLVGIGIIYLCMGGNLNNLLQVAQQLPPPQAAPPGSDEIPADDPAREFVGVVLADTEDVWRDQFRQIDETYREPTLVLFSGQVSSACGYQDAATGPFYCPRDQKVYIDLSFFQEMERRLGAPGDFAQAYVIAHEVGHHVQNLLNNRQRLEQQHEHEDANQHSVRLELQADFYAGVWAHHAQKMWGTLEAGDIAEALNAANAIGDDRLQRQARGTVIPESFTHGTSRQRMRWFTQGYETGDMAQGELLFELPYAEL